MIAHLAITGTNGKTTTAALAREILRFRDLRKSFGGRVVLDGVSAEVRPGEVILLRGQNGSGKTTLLNILTGCLAPDSGTITYNPAASSHEIESDGGGNENLPSKIKNQKSSIINRHSPISATRILRTALSTHTWAMQAVRLVIR